VTFWIVFTLVLAVLIMLGIERLMARLGVRPVAPEETRTGVALFAQRLERWAERRRGDARPHDDEQNS
jgi:hypothetical protein